MNSSTVLPGNLVRVIAWPIADPRQRFHLADAATVDVRGVTVCGEAVKERAEPPWDRCEWCPRCKDFYDEKQRDRIARAEPGGIIAVDAGRFVETGYGIDQVDGSSTIERAERRRSS